MLFQSQSELNESSKTPGEEAPAEHHIKQAVERFYVRKNTTEDVKINAYKLEEFYELYNRQKKELAELKKKMKEASELLNIDK